MVCCRAGMGRSVSVVMAYLCCVQGMTYAEVLKLVMKRRPGAMPLPNLEDAINQVRLLREARETSKKNLASRPPPSNHSLISARTPAYSLHVSACIAFPVPPMA